MLKEKRKGHKGRRGGGGFFSLLREGEKNNINTKKKKEWKSLVETGGKKEKGR